MSECEGIQDALNALSHQVTDLTTAIGKIKPAGLDELKRRLDRIEWELSHQKTKLGNVGATANAAKSVAAEAAKGVVAAIALGTAAKSKAFAAWDNAVAAKLNAQQAQQVAGFAQSKATTAYQNAIVSFKRATDASDAAKAASSIAGKAKDTANRAASLANGVADTAKNALSKATSAAGKAGKALSQAADNASGLKNLTGRFGGLLSKVIGIANILGTFVTIAQLTALTIRMGKTEGKVADHSQRINWLEKYTDRINNRVTQLNEFFGKNIEKVATNLKQQIDKIYQQMGLRDNAILNYVDKVKADIKQDIDKLYQYINQQIQLNYKDHQRIEASIKTAIEKVTNFFNQQIQKNFADHESLRNEFKQSISKVYNYINQQINSIKNWVENLLKGFNPNIAIGAIAAAAAALALAKLLPMLPNLIRNNSPKMTCKFNDTAARLAQQAAQSADRKTTILNTFTQGALYRNVTEGFKGTFLRLGAPIPGGGIGAKLRRFTKSQLWDKAMSVLTFIAVLHNASMLSNAVYLTMTETLNIMVDVIGNTLGLRDEDNKPFDSQQVLGKQFNEVMATLLGDTRWAEIKQTMQAANRTYQAAANAVYTMRSMTDSTLAITQWTAENLAKIGNGLKADGLVSANAYGWMPTVITPQTALINRLQNLDDAASSLNLVASEVQSVQLEAAELAKQKDEFGKEIDKSKKQMEELADVWEDNSKSPDIPRNLLPNKDDD